MSEKYTGLTEEIWRADEGRTSFGSVEMVLDYLDTNPDRAPGRTMTESGCRDLYHAAQYGVKAFRGELEDQGFAFIADPEPTNAEKLAKVIREIGYDIRHNGRLSGSNALALDLDARGVKAPGGDGD